MFNQSLLNTSRKGCDYEYFVPLDQYLNGLIVLPIILFGILTNIVTIRVFSSPSMRKYHINWYIVILGVSDSLLLLCGLIGLSLPRLAEITSLWTLARIGNSLAIYTNPVQNIIYFFCIWLNVTLFIHRFIGICFPFRARQILTTKRVVLVLLLLGVVSIALNVSRFFELRLKTCYMKQIGVELPWIKQTKFGTNKTYRIVKSWTVTVFYFALPFAILSTVSVFIARAIRKSSQMLKQMGNETSDKRKIERENNFTLMLVIIIITFLLCNTLAFVNNILAIFRCYNAMDIVNPLNNFLIMSNPLINTCIYWRFRASYREAIRKFLCKCRTRNYDVTRSGHVNFQINNGKDNMTNGQSNMTKNERSNPTLEISV